jgi:hypothetical protein
MQRQDHHEALALLIALILDCRHLSSRLFASNNADFHPIFDFLLTLSYNGQSLMLNERIKSAQEMGSALDKADRLLKKYECDVSVLSHCRPRE